MTPWQLRLPGMEADIEDLDNVDGFFDYEPVLVLPTRRWRLLMRRRRCLL